MEVEHLPASPRTPERISLDSGTDNEQIRVQYKSGVEFTDRSGAPRQQIKQNAALNIKDPE